MIRFILRPRSAWATPLRADTLYGLLLMRMGEEQGTQAVAQCLEAFRDKAPPFVLSSAMPKDMLFAPCLPPIPRGDFQKLASAGHFKDTQGTALSLQEALQAHKKFRKRSYISVQEWQAHAAKLSTEALFASFCAHTCAEHTQEFSKMAQEPHVSLCRKSGSALQGGLYHNRLTYYNDTSLLHLYAKTQDSERLLQQLQRIGQLGFGKDASTGKGRFDITLDTSFTANALDNGGTWQLLLSPYASENMQGLDGWYAADIKRGKAAMHISRGIPYKNPFICIREGAVLAQVPHVSCVLDGVHSHEHIAQIVTPLSIPCQYVPENFKE